MFRWSPTCKVIVVPESRSVTVFVVLDCGALPAIEEQPAPTATTRVMATRKRMVLMLL
jgi:hypothetical protein